MDRDTVLRSSCLGVASGDLGGTGPDGASNLGFGFGLGGGCGEAVRTGLPSRINVNSRLYTVCAIPWSLLFLNYVSRFIA